MMSDEGRGQSVEKEHKKKIGTRELKVPMHSKGVKSAHGYEYDYLKPYSRSPLSFFVLVLQSITQSITKS